MEQERIGTRALFFKFSGLWIILFYFIFWSDYYGMQFIWIGVHLRGVYSFSSAVDFIFSSSFTFIWHVHYWQLCSWLSMVGGAVFVFCLRGEKKRKKQKASQKKVKWPHLFWSQPFFFIFYRLFIASEKNGRRKAWNLHSTESSRLFSFLLECATSIGSTRWRPWYSIELQSRLERKGLYCILVD